MIKTIDYRIFDKELNQIRNSNNKQDLLECAYHYGHFGFNAYALKYLKAANHTDQQAFDQHLCQLDSLQQNSDLALNDFTKIKRGNCNFLTTAEYELVFPGYETISREIGIYIQTLPFLEVLHQQGLIKSIKINCTERLRELFSLYFPYIEIGTSSNKVNFLEIIEHVQKKGGAALVRGAVKNIALRTVKNKNPRFVGINWFANNILDRYRSIPIGTLINTVGSHDKDLHVMSLQYNDPNIEIDIYNRYAKNKIIQTFDNDINTTPVEILEAVGQCNCFVGIQSEAAMMAYNLLGIPTIVTASSPNLYWYFLNHLNPYLHTVQMRFAGDYDYIVKKIRNLL
jgi:hypothetical protein